MVRSLPMLPALPRPGDVAATELVAPPMFPLRAVATLEPCPAAVAAGAPVPTSPPKLPAVPAAAAHGHAEAPARHPAHGSAEGATRSAPAPAQQPQRQPGFWQRLLGRGGQQQQDPLIHLYIRVDGRGLENVTRAWVDGVGPAAADGDAAKGSDAGKGGGDAREAVAEVSIMQQPRPRLPLHSAEQQRPPLPVVGHVSAFFSW